MTKTFGSDSQGTSTRPYLLRALHEWCTDNGFTPYIAVHVDARVQVPLEYVKNGEIVLNVGFEATSGLKLGNEQIEFKARFGGTPREIVVPIDHVVAIYARENGQGMAFPAPTASGEGVPDGSDAEAETRLELDEIVAESQAARGLEADVEHDLVVLHVLHRHLYAGIHMHRDVGREAVVGAPLVQRAQQVGPGRSALPVGAEGLCHAARTYLRITFSDGVSASM